MQNVKHLWPPTMLYPCLSSHYKKPYFWIVENGKETTIVNWGYIGILEKKMETTILSWALGFRRVLAELALRFLLQEFVKVIYNRNTPNSKP